MVTRGCGQKEEMTYNDKDCDHDRDAFDPIDGRLASRTRCPKILEEAKRQRYHSSYG